jgi:hypothetical protein
MFVDPSIRSEIARERQRDLLAKSERHRLAKDAIAGRKAERGRPIEPPALDERPPKRIVRPQQANT